MSQCKYHLKLLMPYNTVCIALIFSFEGVEEDFSEDSSEESEVMPESPKHSVDLSEVERSTTDAVNAVGRQQIGEDSPWDRCIVIFSLFVLAPHYCLP